jgi:2'-5' RNA ligase
MGVRCFIAIDISPIIRDSIGHIMEIFRKTGADVKWVRPENIHVTLKFLGTTDESQVTTIVEALTKKILRYSTFYIKISNVGCFPDMKRPRVIWVGIEKSEMLRSLHMDIEQEMVQFGYPEEKRTFSAHITIGRVRSQRRMRDVINQLEELRSQSFGDMEINRVNLMKSELKPAGAQYYTLAEIPLGRRNDV